MTAPLFAIVGHPNKGKSSIVATLAQDDSVRIAADAGTTIQCRRYPMRIDGREIYTLIDTPGFQRARGALDWMRSRETSADQRPGIVAAFVEEHRADDEFPDECRLLAPLVEGAGILYVVDGSRPFGPEYEAEMEILRWTGRPSMALINIIGDGDYLEQWQAGLGQYFKVVRIFDAHHADFAKRLDLLRTFGQLAEPWRAPLEQAAQSLVQDRRERHGRAARSLAEMLSGMLTLTVTQRIDIDADPAAHQAALESEYRDTLRRLEHQGREQIEQIYDHRRLHRNEPAFQALLEEDLFTTDRWFVWGLNRRQLLARSAAGGALAGGAIDVGVSGASFLLGSIVGAAVGTAGAWLGSEKLARAKVMHLPLGGTELRYGPARSLNLPYVILGRALYHHQLVATRVHARRDPLDLSDQSRSSSWIDRLPGERKKDLERCFARLRR
ncbi:MAG: GTPase/DUF3482 domain-containing protein, partial [Phycisphaerae bacterium]|nr:GTPase/DUF3482 domain-containing protein [Phycisphaerae bacterium]